MVPTRKDIGDGELEEQLRSPCDPSPDALLDLCRSEIGDRIIEAIAAADYRHEADEHRIRLLELLAANATGLALRWHPGEVLRLTRWTRPDSRSGCLTDLGLSESHWARLLACTLLLRAHSEQQWHDTLAYLIDSARWLGPRVEAAARRFVAWRLGLDYGGSWAERASAALAFGWFGLAYLSVRAEPEVDRDWLRASCSYCERVESHWSAHAEPGRGSQMWLLRCEPIFTNSHGLWQSFATDGWHRAGRREPPVVEFRRLCERMRPELASP